MKKTQFLWLVVFCLVACIVAGVVIFWYAGPSIWFWCYIAIALVALFASTGLYIYPDNADNAKKAENSIEEKPIHDVPATIEVKASVTETVRRPIPWGKMIFWTIVILVIVLLFNHGWGTPSSGCENISESSGQITMGDNLTCVSMILDAGEMSPLINLPVNAGFSRFTISSNENQPFSTYYPDGSSYYKGLDQQVKVPTIERSVEIQADENNTAITVSIQ